MQRRGDMSRLLGERTGYSIRIRLLMDQGLKCQKPYTVLPSAENKSEHQSHLYRKEFLR